MLPYKMRVVLRDKINTLMVVPLTARKKTSKVMMMLFHVEDQFLVHRHMFSTHTNTDRLKLLTKRENTAFLFVIFFNVLFPFFHNSNHLVKHVPCRSDETWEEMNFFMTINDCFSQRQGSKKKVNNLLIIQTKSYSLKSNSVSLVNGCLFLK